MRTQWLMAIVLGMRLTAGVRPATDPADVIVYMTVEDQSATYQSTVLVTSMFDHIGVHVAWHRGEAKAAVPGSVTLNVRLTALPGTCSSPEALACAYPFAAADRAITVFSEQVRAVASRAGTPEYVLLAHVLVHEITHVLQRVDRHSETGVMKAVYSLRDEYSMIRGPLPFEPADVYLIRQGLDTLRSYAGASEARRPSPLDGFH